MEAPFVCHLRLSDGRENSEQVGVRDVPGYDRNGYLWLTPDPKCLAEIVAHFDAGRNRCVADVIGRDGFRYSVRGCLSILRSEVCVGRLQREGERDG